MNIVLLSYLHGFGGAEKQIVMLANALAERNHDVSLISVCADNNCYSINKEVHYYHIPDRHPGKYRIIFRYYDLAVILNKIRPNITISFWYQTAYLTAMMPSRITGKRVYSERGDPGDSEYSGMLGIVRKLTMPLIDGFVFQSKGAQQYFNNDIINRSVIIPNPVFVNPLLYNDHTSNEKCIVNVGRLHPQKNQKLLIEAFSMIADEFPDYRLEIFGEGVLKDELTSLINQLGLENRVVLKGTTDRIYDEIKNASLFVLSSDYEGIPNTLLEAMALGIPCISTDCKPGGAREIISSPHDGLIVPVGNSSLLSDAIRQSLADYEMSRRRASIGQLKMMEYQPAIIYDKWESFLFSLVEEK